MKFEIVKIREMSGRAASVYSVIVGNDDVTLFEQFIGENSVDYAHEVEDIVQRLFEIGTRLGARLQFFKTGEGPIRSHVCAFYDQQS